VQAQPTLKNDKSVLAAFRTVVAKPSQSTVRILCDGKVAALGTIVAEDGWIVTKASELKGKIACKLKDGKTWEARLVGVDDRTDLAMLKIDARGLRPIEWADVKSAVVGNWLASPGLGEGPVAVGVVSVAARVPAMRDMPTPTPAANSGYLGILLADSEGAPKIDRVEPNTPAAKAGLQRGDVVLAVEGDKVPSAERLVRRISSLKAGAVVKLTIKRGEEEKEITATLGKRPRDAMNRGEMQNNMGSKLSTRRGGFPAILQHDTVLQNTDCGGPLVGLDGKAVGVNIARAGRTESYAIPSDRVLSLLADLRSGKLAPKKDTPAVNVEELRGSIKKMKDDLAAKRKTRAALDEKKDAARAKALTEQIEALGKRLATAEAALEKARQGPGGKK
jgi:serine protease Do